MKNIISILFLFIVIDINAQNNEALQQISQNIEQQLQLYPQEKLYLQCDKPDYVSGEKVWFRLFLVDAATHIPNVGSRYAYVELIGEGQDTVTYRVKIKPDANGLFHGYMPLPQNLSEGTYQLKAYTKYMSNQTISPCFTRYIRVFLPGNKKTQTKAPNTKDDYDVQLFPEGGYLLDGTVCRVAFKAVGDDGLHEDISGTLTDEQGTILDSIHSLHDGMGVFGFVPQVETKYYVNCINKRGKSKRIELPSAQTNTYSLTVNEQSNKLFITVKKPSKKDTVDKLTLLIHTRGIVQYISDIKDIDNPIVLDKKSFPSGVSQILLLDADNNPISERLAFINNDDSPSLTIISNKEEYDHRDSVNIQTQIKNVNGGSFSISVLDGNDLQPDNSTSILTSLLLTSELKGNIENPEYYFQKENRDASAVLDILMMTQGWRRYEIPKAIKNDYEKPKTEAEKWQSISGYAENENILKNTDVKEGKIMFFAPEYGYLKDTTTNKDGTFCFDKLLIPDSTTLIIQALTAKNGKNVILTLNEDTYPSIDRYGFTEKSRPESMEKDLTEKEKDEDKNILPNMESYITKANQKYISENGMREIYLPEVLVKKKVEMKKSVYAINSSFTITGKEIEENHYISVGDALNKIPNLILDDVNGNAYIRGAAASFKPLGAIIVIDDMVFDGNHYTDVNINDIATIDVVHSSGAQIFGSRGAGGAIVITTKKGKDRQLEPNESQNIKTIIPLGYQKPAEFYSPKYATEKEKNNPNTDLRTTIYWKPDVLISKEGSASFSFYTADSSSKYHILIEGVTSDGQLIHKYSTINVR